MIQAEWNALQVGDAVLIHDGVADGAPLLAASVAEVDASQVPHSVGLRMTEPVPHGGGIAWPSRLRVHQVPRRSAALQCRWCPAVANGPPG